MRTFLGIVRYEHRMGVRRWGVWLAMLLAAIAFESAASWRVSDINLWQTAAVVALLSNLFTPVIAGIAIADRLPRDSQVGVLELLRSTSMTRRTYVLGKYVGAVAAVLTPVFVIYLISLGLLIAGGLTPGILGPSMVAFVAINVPAYLFIGAFSLACPAFLPVRIYQVLFTGYWMWGNFLSPEVIPTLNGTVLTPSGVFAAGGFFGANQMFGQSFHTTSEAVINLAIMFACIALALLVLDRFLAWQEARA